MTFIKDIAKFEKDMFKRLPEFILSFDYSSERVLVDIHKKKKSDARLTVPLIADLFNYLYKEWNLSIDYFRGLDGYDYNDKTVELLRLVIKEVKK